MPDLAQWYARRRGSPGFALGLIAFVALWLCVHYLTGFDHAFGALNLCLSTEASVSLAFFTMMGDRQTADSAKSLRALADALDEQRRMTAMLLRLAEDSERKP